MIGIALPAALPVMGKRRANVRRLFHKRDNLGSRHLTTRTSPAAPLPHILTKPAVKPRVDATQNPSHVEGRHPGMAARRSPSKSPSSGTSPWPPHVVAK